MVKKTPKMFFRYNGEGMSLVSIYNKNKKRRGRSRYLLSVMVDVVKDSDSPCFLCARMRRGCLYSKAKELGCNKIALGHHFNDVIETILLNMIYNGKFSGMLPILDSDNFPNMKLIRPLYYIKEKDILSWVKYTEMNFIDCACKVTKKNLGKRKEIKQLSYELVDMYENADINILNSMFHVNPNTTFIDSSIAKK